MENGRVAVSIESGSDLRAPVCPSFGRAPRFLVTKPETEEGFEVIENTAARDSHGAGVGAAGLMGRLGVTAVISGRFGPKAYQALHAAGIEMYVALTQGTAAAALERYRNGDLKQFEVRSF